MNKSFLLFLINYVLNPRTTGLLRRAPTALSRFGSSKMCGGNVLRATESATETERNSE